MANSLHQYSKRNFSGVFLLGGLAMLTFVLPHWRAGNLLMVGLIMAIVLTIWGLAVWALIGKRIATLPVMIVTGLCNFGCLIAMMQLRELSVYWFYPLLMAIAYVMPWRWAIPINVANVAMALIEASAWLPEGHYSRLVATLIVALAFSCLFSYNLERQQEMLTDLVVHDPLTGAYNRRYFEYKLEEARRLWKRTGQTSGMVLIDIDHFKEINDTYGHRVGDDALVALTAYLTSQLRPQDRFFRLGGEEFAILLPEATASQSARLAERLRAHIAAGPLKKGVPAFTVSCGVAAYPEPGTTTDWPEQCDAALYAAKEAGRNRIAVAEQHTMVLPDKWRF